MIRFLLKGILKDRSRSLLPVIVVSIGVMLTVIVYCWIEGIMGDSLQMNANFNNGHVRIMTRAYAENPDQMPNDLALMGVDSLLKGLKGTHPEMDWVSRIRFGALADFPDDSGVTRAQGPVVGWGLDLLSGGSQESTRFNLAGSILEGRMPAKPSEALISQDLATKCQISTGDRFTLFGTTMDGSMALKNFTVAGTVRFGISAIDRGAVIIDLKDAQQMLSMQDAASEILGYFPGGEYNDEQATNIAAEFNQQFAGSRDEYAPVMQTFKDQEGMAQLLGYTKVIGSMMVFIFVLAMSVVLWNAGLLGSLRRYNEFGVRLALGEGKTHIYKSLIYEGLLIGLMGTLAGTLLGLGISYILQVHGFNLGTMMQSSSMMFPSTVRAHVTPTAYWIGLLPGLCSTVLGSSLAGIGIYKRQTARLFKELEV